MIPNSLNPKFAKKFVIDYYFEMVQRLKFCVYDIDNNTYNLDDDDFLGECECTLGQVSFISFIFDTDTLILPSNFNLFFLNDSNVCVQIASNRQMTRPLLFKDHRPAGCGTITVSGLLSGFEKTKGLLFCHMVETVNCLHFQIDMC